VYFKLHLSHGTAGRSDPPKLGATESGIRKAPDGVVEEIERLHPELQGVSFFDAEVLFCSTMPRKMKSWTA
jgi:hypothetical protein